MASRKEQKEAARAERLAKQQAAEAADKRKRLIGVGAAAVLAVAIVAVLVVVVAGGGGSKEGTEQSGPAANIEISYPDGPDAPKPGPNASNLKAAAAEAKCKLVDPPNEGASHVEEDVVYKASPPTSGNHDINPSEDKTYTSPPEAERSVHALEHGRIQIQFKADAPEDVIGRLKKVFDEDPYHVMLFPNGTKMAPQVAATAWDHQLMCATVSDKTYDAIRAFKNEYRDKGPEFVP